MRCLPPLLLAACLHAQPALRLDPAVATDCRDGYAMLKVSWAGAGVDGVTVFAGSFPVSGAEPARGSLDTGWWVSDGMEFRLLAPNGATLAQARAAVRCGAQLRAPGPSWWPLAVGNEWRFRFNSRQTTGEHGLWRVARAEEIAGRRWFVLEPGPEAYRRLREDADGRVFRLDSQSREQLVFDPTQANAGLWSATSREIADTPLGLFAESAPWRAAPAGLGQESGQLLRGVGPLRYAVNIVAGSSGGFSTGLELIEARIGNSRFSPNYPSLELQLESQLADVTARKARNCAVPCYFTACGLVPGADPPGTYKPCLEASLSRPGELRLVDASGQIRHRATLDDAGFVRIPLWNLPLGDYRVEADAAGGFRASSPLSIR
jgi:hypothetical protein